MEEAQELIIPPEKMRTNDQRLKIILIIKTKL